MRGRRALALLVCLGASAGLTKPSPRTAKQDAVDAHLATARDVSSGKVAELDSHKGGESAGGNAIDALGHDDPAASKGTLSHVEDAPKDTKLKAETAYTAGGHAQPVLETKVSQHKTQGADVEHAELADAHKGGDAIDAAAHGDGDPVEDAPQTITSEAAAFDTEDNERVAGEGDRLSGSMARGVAAEMIESKQRGRAILSVGSAETDETSFYRQAALTGQERVFSAFEEVEQRKTSDEGEDDWLSLQVALYGAKTSEHESAEQDILTLTERMATPKLTTRPAFEQGRRRLECVDTDAGATDSVGAGCSYYSSYPARCDSTPNFDDEDFTASEQCCACGGGEGTFAPTPVPTFAPTVTPVPSSSPCEAYTVSGAEHQTTRIGTYVASDTCDGKTLYECIGCSSSNIEYLYYYAPFGDWRISSNGCGSEYAWYQSSETTSDDPSSERWWEWSGSDWVETYTISVQCFKSPAPTVTPAPTATSVPTRTPWVADDESIRTAVNIWFSDRAAAEATYGHISTWDTSGVGDMSELFCVDENRCSFYNKGAATFNEDISAWDTSGVTDMRSIFRGASSFNQPIGNWRVDKVTSMSSMFSGASDFNQDIGGWSVDGVTDMRGMFDGASAFNQDIGTWRVDQVTDMIWMFEDASAFDQALGWCVRTEIDLQSAFDRTQCESTSCGVVQGTCPNPEAAVGEYCKLGDPKFCSGSRYSFVKAPSNPFANISENRYAVPTLNLDGDGNDDLLVGLENGTLALYRHAGPEYHRVPHHPFENITVHGHAAPALVDLDGDRLLDLVVGAQGGGLAFYKNRGTVTAPVFTKVSDAVSPCGDDLKSVNATECPASLEVIRTLPPCDVAVCGELCEGDGECGTRNSLDNCGNVFCESTLGNDHRCDVYRKFCDARPGPFAAVDLSATFTAPAFSDLDGDGLVDFVIGKATSGALTYYKNVGSSTTAQFQAVPVGPFSSVFVGRYSKPTFYDIDNDGDQDLIVGDGIGNVLLFLNVGSGHAPEFSVVEDALSGSIKSHAAPALGVLNGVPSLVVGSAPGQLVVYGEAPVKLEFAASKVSSFDGIDVGTESKPAFADLDGDGLLDLVVGEEFGYLKYYRNVGTQSQPNFEKVDEGSPFDSIEVDGASTPTFADLDNDGDLDLVVGDEYGRLSYYRNAGTQSQPSFEKGQDCSPGSYSYSYSYASYSYEDEDDDGVERRLLARQLLEEAPALAYIEGANPFCGIDVGLDSAPVFVDLDGDEDLDLVVGERDGTLNYYRNVGTPSQPSFEKVDEESPFDSIDVGKYSNPTFVDLDGDGLLDLVVGEVFGGLRYYRNVGTASQPNFEKVGCVDDLTTTGRNDLDCLFGPRICSGFDDDDFTASEQCCVCGGGVTKEESPFDGIDVGYYSAPKFVDIDGDGDEDLVVGDGNGQLRYLQNDQVCRKTGEDGACSGHGVCGAFKGGKATCECLFSFEREQCDACREGNYGQDCQPCPDNTWSQGGVEPTCDECRVGFYRATNSTCESCGEDKVCETTDVTLDNFECIAGTYRAGDECENCKSGMICDEPGVTIENVRLKKNRWRTSAESAKIETCPLKKSCRSTKRGPDANVSVTDGGDVARRLEAATEPANTTDAGEALCTKGHEGPLCAVCKRHYYRLGQECIKCRPSTIAFTVLGILVGIVVFLAFFLMAMTYSNLAAKGAGQAFEENKEESQISLSRQGSTYFAHSADRPEPTDVGSQLWRGLKQWLSEGDAADALRRNVTTFVKQLSGTYSIFVNLPWVFDIKFPNLYEKVLERLAIVNVNMSFSLECVMSRKVTFQDQLLAATIGPIIAILIVILLGVLWLGFKRNEHKHRKDRKRTTTLVIAQLVLLILFLSYTSTSTIIFRAFRPCDDLGEPYHGSNEYMHDDYSVSCKSSRYVFIVTWAALMLLVYPIGIPLVSFCLMWRHQEKLDPKVDPNFIDRDINFGTVGESDSAFRHACVKQKTELRSEKIQAETGTLVSAAQLFHFMYDNYEPKYWWFECFDYLRRLALTGLMVIIVPGSALQGFIGVLIAFYGVLAYVHWKPFKEDASDLLGVSTQLTTFFVFLSVLMVQVNAVIHRNGFGVLLTVVTFIPPFVSLGAALREFNFLREKEDSSSKAPAPAKDDVAPVADPEASPQSPLAQNAPPQEDEEAPAAPAQN